MFELKVGDVSDFLGTLRLILEDGAVYEFGDRDGKARITRAEFFQLRPQVTGKVHRPTPEGLVQVWPEVVE